MMNLKVIRKYIPVIALFLVPCLSGCVSDPYRIFNHRGHAYQQIEDKKRYEEAQKEVGEDREIKNTEDRIERNGDSALEVISE